ncbi:hypothetical protein RB195_024603 [Necator americanus]|uniref:Uncharacterized protein n=1 Tax=Necator americanus TaxID=51031 RepID=A0ABR1ENU8_NECAM
MMLKRSEEEEVTEQANVVELRVLLADLVRIRHFIASAPRIFVVVVDVEDPSFISSDNGVQPVESAASGEQLSADVQASLAVPVAQCMWEPLTELLFTITRDRSPLLTMDSE